MVYKDSAIDYKFRPGSGAETTMQKTTLGGITSMEAIGTRWKN